MSRAVGALLAILFLSSCAQDSLTSMQQNLAQAAQEQLKRTLATHFIAELGKGVGGVITSLAQPGGYLDNPLVRILLPPPLGLVFDVARNLNADPQATLLEALMNHAAEQAIPNAAPILQAALAHVTPTEARALLDGGKTAATDYLQAKTAGALQQALAPLVSANLAASGAQQVYGKLLDTYQAQRTGELAKTDEKAPDLAQYVTGQAVAGVFKALGERETLIRENLDTVTGGVLEGMGKSPATEAPAQPAPEAR
jgi:hypothetical protein